MMNGINVVLIDLLVSAQQTKNKSRHFSTQRHIRRHEKSKWFLRSLSRCRFLLYVLLDVGRVDMIVAGAGSGGTFTGLAHYFKDAHKVIVEPQGSILNGGESGSHRTEGIGVEKWPGFLPKDLIDAVETISDIDAFTKVSELAKLEGLMQGSSSGAALQAALNQQQHFTNQNIVVIFPDASDRDLSQAIFNIKGE